jgi:hypothetical protein
LLHAADLLVAVLSNIIVNAALMGTPTLVCDFVGHRGPLDFVKEGLSLGCFDAAELPAMLRALLPGGERREEALSLLRRGIARFSKPSDGLCAQRVAGILDRMISAAERGRGESA